MRQTLAIELPLSTVIMLRSIADNDKIIESLLHAAHFRFASFAAVVLFDRVYQPDLDVEHLDVALEYVGPSSRYFGSIFTQGRWADIYSCALILSGSCENDE